MRQQSFDTAAPTQDERVFNRALKKNGILIALETERDSIALEK
jgi:hypothetical protein